MIEFSDFGKIARWSRTVTITEKIDGTNASIYIGEDGEFLVGSRNRWITPDDDNYGFATWAYKNRDELMQLGVGHHFGEWWGLGIQRKYNAPEKRFSLFNASRWGVSRPACCHVVPVLYEGILTANCVDDAINVLRINGSRAAPEFMNPEGIIIWHEAARVYFKKTLHKDVAPKSVSAMGGDEMSLNTDWLNRAEISTIAGREEAKSNAWHSRDAEVAELKAELDKQRTETLTYFGQNNELKAKLTESQRLLKVALEAMKLTDNFLTENDMTLYDLGNAIKEIEGRSHE